MRSLQRYALLPLLLALLAATAGCSGGLPGGGSDGGPATATEPTPDETLSTAAETTGDAGTPDFLWRNEPTLRQAGNVTVNSTYVERVGDGNGTVVQRVTRENRIGFDRDRVYSVLNTRSGTPVERYQTETGATFARSTEGLEPSYRGPDATSDIDVSERVRHLPVDPSTLERRGYATVDGVTGTVYTDESAGSAAEDGYERYFQYNVTEFSLTFVVDDAGHVSYERLDLTMVREGTPLSVTQRVRYTDVGSTTVPEPDWLDEAKAAATESESDGQGTATDDG